MPSKADREMWARLHVRGVVLNAADFPVAIYRQHGGQMSRSKKKRSEDPRLHEYLTDAVRKRSSGDMDGLEFL
jgi:ribosomal protein L2